MEHLEGEQYSQYPVERNPRAYMSMRDYRNQWMSSPYGSAYNHSWGNHTNSSWEPRPPQYAPSFMMPPQYTSTPQPPQPPQLISPVKQAILDLTKLVGDAVVEQKEFNAQLSKKIHIVENPLEQKLDGFQSEVGQQVDNLQCSISKLAQQLDHQGEENPEDECLTETIFGEQTQL